MSNRKFGCKVGSKKRKHVKKNVYKYSGCRCRPEDILVCPLCGRLATAKEWDDNTLPLCKSKEDYDLFRSVTLNISKRKGCQDLKYYYLCVGCGTVISGDRFEGYIKHEDIEQEAE